MPKEVDLKQFIAIWNNLESYPSVADVAEACGISIKTARNKAGFLRTISKGSPGAGKIIVRSSTSEAPLSEDSGKFMEAWDEQDCIAELRRIAEKDTEVVITRNYFRNHSAISESTWSRFFGTFEEFKRQAGLKLSRQQHQLERNIAKHASVDHYRQLNVDRKDFAAKYTRDRAGRFKTIMVCSDLHDIEIDRFFLRTWLDTVARVQPDVIVFVGDCFDLPEFGKYGVDPREWDVVGRIKFVHEQILGPTRAAAPEAQIDFIEGNHEARLLRHMADATPALRAVLADLHGFTVGKLLGLDKYQINYIAKADLGAFTKQDFERQLSNNYKVYFDSFLCHHFPHARNMGLPGVNGHHHKHQVWAHFSPIYGAYEWHQLGSGHKRSASYCEGERWHNGFAIVNIDTHTRSTSFDYISVTDFAVAGGKWYYREPVEVDSSIIKPLLMSA